MPQNAEKILDYETLFKEPEYVELLDKKKKGFENAPSAEEVQRICDWTKTPEYMEKNFARESLVINPVKSCQPLGAVYVANGFSNTLPFVHGSQGCVAYFRSHFTRHFKEPTSCVSTSMTEDAAVFGGMNNMIDGLTNSINLYKPEMIAVSTTCMAEVIGDDLDSFIKNAKEKNSIPSDYDVPFAHTPSFVGSHITGYDNMMRGVMTHFWDGKSGTTEPLVRTPNESINFIGGFDGNVVGNMPVIRGLFEKMGIDYTLLCDPSDVWNTPTDGEFRTYDGGTTKEEVEQAINAKATIMFQEYCGERTTRLIEEKGQEVVQLNHPMGVTGTDRFLMELSRISGKPIPEELTKERGRLVDAMADSQAFLHGKKFALFGDPDMMVGLTEFLLDLGCEPVHVMSTNANPEWETRVQAMLDGSTYGQGGKAYARKDLWHMRSLLFNEPVDFLLGNSFGKYLEQDCGVPLVRIGFPITDRHHHHRFPIWGYEGGLRVLVSILDKYFDGLDASTIGTSSFDLVR